MLQNYLRIALRSLQRRPGPTLINVIGLSVGLAACLLIGLWVQNQLRYDDFHPHADRTYRVALDAKIQDREIQGPMTPGPMADALAREFPSVEGATRFRSSSEEVARIDDRTFTDQRILYSDSSFFDVLSGFRLLHGTASEVLAQRDAVVLTASTAQRYFGTTNPVGETLELNDDTYRVAGVVADVPQTSHVHFDAVAAEQLTEQQRSMWVGNNYYTYVRLTPGTPPDVLASHLAQLVDRYVAPQIEEFLGASIQTLFEQGARYEYFPQAITAIHLHSDMDYELEANGSIAYVYTFSAIALFILLIACVNFMNLATARASERATEVGMRKALGAHRSQLAGQFLGEALLTATVATAGALGVALLALPAFNDLAGTTIGVGDALVPSVFAGGLALVVGVGLVAGSYPALVLSQFEPATVLKSNDRHGTGGSSRLRQALVVFQFTISIALIAGTLVVHQQFDYIQEKRLGFDKERVLVVNRAWTLQDQQAAFAERVAALPGVVNASAGSRLFDTVSNTAFVPDDRSPDQSHSINYVEVDFRFAETMGLEVVSGRTFSPDRGTDSTAVLINRAAADAIGWTDAEGHRLRAPGIGGETVVYDVIGIVENFHYQSMRQEVHPLVLMPDDLHSVLYVRAAPGATPDVLNRVRDAWQKAVPQQPFQYTFLDQTYAEIHRDTQRTGRLFLVFAGLAVVIACLGLFGLATHVTQRRTREIGLRKALGATSTQIVRLLSKDFLLLVGVAFVVAVPIAYVSMTQWLHDFAYRVDLGVWVFALAGVLAVLVAFGTVSTQAVRAARTDPAISLHHD